jgi:small-conductance mechanosensitive channel
MAAILVPVSSVIAGGVSAWPAFLKNTMKHAGTPVTNDMGLRTIVGFRWETRQKVSYDARLVDKFHNFREARRSAFRGSMPLYLALIIAYLALLSWGLRREMDWWVLAAFGFGVIAMSMELTCYYFSFLTVAAFLWEKRENIVIGLLLLASLSQVIEFVTYYYDMRYTLESIAVTAFVIWATWSYGRGTLDAGSSPETARAITPTP